MSDDKAKKPATNASTPAPAGGSKAGKSYSSEKTKKNPWTLERCKKLARRYTSTEEWENGSPSSFKAAESHGWIAECKGLFKKPIAKKLKKSA